MELGYRVHTEAMAEAVVVPLCSDKGKYGGQSEVPHGGWGRWVGSPYGFSGLGQVGKPDQ